MSGRRLLIGLSKSPTVKQVITMSKKKLKRVFHFSGGHTSALMVMRFYVSGDIVIFCDTGREHPDTYRFINDFSIYTGIPVIIVSTHNAWRNLLKKRKAIPNQFKRFCTIELKAKAARRYLRKIGLKSYIQFIGFRHDEPDRIANYKERWQTVKTFFPLNDGVTTSHVVERYFSTVNWRLKIPKILGNCTLCFQKGYNNIMSILSVYPELATPWIEDEELFEGKYTYIKNMPMRLMLQLSQSNLFSRQELESLIPAFRCSCNAG